MKTPHFPFRFARWRGAHNYAEWRREQNPALKRELVYVHGVGDGPNKVWYVYVDGAAVTRLDVASAICVDGFGLGGYDEVRLRYDFEH